jgi:excisionase family DNA binding protein
MMLEEYPDILTVEEACEVLRVGYNAMYELLNSGKVKAYRNGRVWRIPKTSLVEFIRNSIGRITKMNC